MTKGKRYDGKIKKEVVQQYLTKNRSGPSLAAELGLHANTIYKWVEQYRADPEHSFVETDPIITDDDELARAKQRICELEEEVELLKKAAVYFAKNSM